MLVPTSRACAKARAKLGVCLPVHPRSQVLDSNYHAVLASDRFCNYRLVRHHCLWMKKESEDAGWAIGGCFDGANANHVRE